jgi:hypothetical protein
MMRDRRKLSAANVYRIGLNRSNVDIIFGLERPLAAEIGIPPFPTSEKALITSKGLKMDRKRMWNTRRKPRSLYRVMAPFPVANAPLRPKAAFQR